MDNPYTRVFDCYCKRVLRNAANDYYEQLARRRSREVPLDDVWAHPSHLDSYAFEERVYNVLGLGVSITNPVIIHALDSLTPSTRTIVLAYSCLGMSDREIAEQLHLVRRTVAYRRAKAFEVLRGLLAYA